MSIRFILVATSHPGNIGAAARAMKNMDLGELVLVRPAAFPHAEATSMASGANDLLSHTRVVATLAEAVADCRLVYGTSARLRSRYYWPGVTPRAAAPQLLATAAAGGRAAVVFGPERTGLSNEELEQCHALIRIPASAAYDSLNLAQAVQVVAYEIHCARGLPAPPERDSPPAAAAELERLYEHFDAVLREIDFTDRSGGPQLLRRLRRIFGRAVLDQQEVNILRGILTAVQARRRRAGAAS